MAKWVKLRGPTDSAIGEYAAAKRRPQWVSFVDVGAILIAQNMAKMCIDGGMGGTIVSEIAADYLRSALKHDSRRLILGKDLQTK